MDTKIELYHDNFQNFKRYNIPKAQLVIADIPYNIGVDAYASNPMWYQGGDNKNGESKLAKSSFFHTDGTFKIAEYMHFCNRLLRKEPKEKGQAPAMIVFCAFEQMQTVIDYGKKYGFEKSYPLFFTKNYSAQVLKANMKIVGATEFAVVLYRDKLPKFRNIGPDGNKHMVFNWFPWERDNRKEYDYWRDACEGVEIRYFDMLAEGCTPQEARSVLPNSLKTEVVMTANIREWRHFLKLRCSPAAHPQMREVALILLDKVHWLIPVCFDDIWSEYHADV